MWHLNFQDKWWVECACDDRYRPNRNPIYILGIQTENKNCGMCQASLRSSAGRACRRGKSVERLDHYLGWSHLIRSSKCSRIASGDAWLRTPWLAGFSYGDKEILLPPRNLTMITNNHIGLPSKYFESKGTFTDLWKKGTCTFFTERSITGYL